LSSVGQYSTTLTNQEDRLQGVGWFEEKIRDTHECPVCAAVHVEGNPRLVELQTLARELKSLTVSVHQAPAKLDQEVAVLRQELRVREGAISKARQKRKYLEDRSAALAAQRQRVRQIYLFVGRVEQALENVSASRNVDELRERVQTLTQKITELRWGSGPAYATPAPRRGTRDVSQRSPTTLVFYSWSTLRKMCALISVS
jgi:phage shock protein A